MSCVPSCVCAKCSPRINWLSDRLPRLRTYVEFRETLATNKELAKRLEELESRLERNHERRGRERLQRELGTCVTMLLPASPIARTPAMVRDRENANLVACYHIDQRVMKTPHDQTTLAETPDRAETWILKQEAYGVLELREYA